MGNVIDYPILTMAIPVKTSAIREKRYRSALDPSLSGG